MADTFVLNLEPPGTNLLIPVQRGLTSSFQAQAVKMVYPKSLNPTVELDRLAAYAQTGANKVSPYEKAVRTAERAAEAMASALAQRAEKSTSVNVPNVTEAVKGARADISSVAVAASQSAPVSLGAKSSAGPGATGYSASGTPVQSSQGTFSISV